MINFLLKVAVISASGALAPGPLTAATAAVGLKRGWKAGIEVSLGHMVVELPLVILLSFGVAKILKDPVAGFFLGVLGSGFLFFFGFSTIREGLQYKQQQERQVKKKPTPLLIGIALSALNPYFIAWWIGIGAPLISEAVNLAGYVGIGLFYIFHVWLDYVWLGLIAGLTSLGRAQARILRWLLLILGGLVIYFGVNMLTKTLDLTTSL
jgi:threonine/homoserine/homoserine lactone efflux protein